MYFLYFIIIPPNKKNPLDSGLGALAMGGDLRLTTRSRHTALVRAGPRRRNIYIYIYVFLITSYIL